MVVAHTTPQLSSPDAFPIYIILSYAIKKNSEKEQLEEYAFRHIHCTNAIIPKGQLISKGLIVSSILPKNELENSNFCPSLMGQKFFVRFLEEFRIAIRPFEINWPLVYSNM